MPSLTSDTADKAAAKPTEATEEPCGASESDCAPQKSSKRIQREPAFPDVIHNYAFYPLGADGYITNESKLQLPEDDMAAADLLFRTLIEIFLYCYAIEDNQLGYALAECTPAIRSRKLSNSRTTLLTGAETRTIVAYADAIHNVYSNVLENSQSLLRDDDRDFIVTYVLKPTQDLHLDPAYMFDHLMAFRTHRCQPGNRKKTLLFKKTTSIWTRGLGLFPASWNAVKGQKLLASWLVSDDMALARLRPFACERLRLIIGCGIKRFSLKHCKLGMGNVSRAVYAEPDTATLVRQLVLAESLKTSRLMRCAEMWDMEPEASFQQNSYVVPRRRRSQQFPRSLSSRSLADIQEFDELPRRPHSVSGVRLHREARAAVVQQRVERFEEEALDRDESWEVMSRDCPAW